MRAWRIESHGPPESLRRVEVPAPRPGEGEVEVRVDAVALNHLDLWVRRGVPGHHFPLPITPGSDIAGRIGAVGPGVSGVRSGEAILVVPGAGCGRCPSCLSGREPLCRAFRIRGESCDGGCAERIVVPEREVLRMPEGLDPVEAASLPLTLVTAWRMLVERAQLRPGETVLVHAAGSGIGVMAIQIARALGARVIATAGSEEKAAKARELGAEEAVLYRQVDFVDAIFRWTERRGVDVVVEHTGAATWQGSLRALAKGGRLVTCGATSGAEVAVDLRRVFYKSLSILGSTMGSRRDLEEALRYVANGRIRAIVDRVFPMEELPAAHAYLEDRRAFGKVVLRGYQEA